MMLGLGAAVSIQPYGPAVPLDYVAQPFNCPPGSDFDKSQEVGMCVGVDYSPIAITAGSGAKVYYDLTGQVGGVEPKKTASTDWILIAGVGLGMVLLINLISVRQIGRRR
jgi:hypothetical protein